MTTLNRLPSFGHFIFLFLYLLPRLSAQTGPESCGTDIFHQNALNDPEFRKKHEAFEQQLLQQFRKGIPQAQPDGAVVTLPVVVHIVHQNGAENISDAQVLQGIQQLNEAYANTGYYDQGSGVNTMIQFCLAKRSPENLPTTGITRNQSPLTNMTLETQDVALKDLNRWDPTRYINIWLVREICSSFVGCGVAGYANFPTAHGSGVDGIVMEATWLGSSPGNTGVLAHEMGHYLGLYHTFQGGCKNDDCLVDGDRVCDTPPDNSTLWVPCSTQVNTCSTDTQSGFATDQNDMILNFMDYTDFNCFHDFTPGQSARMNFTVQNTRASLLASKACQDPCPTPVVAAFTPLSATIPTGQSLNFINSSQNAGSYTWSVDGVPFANTTNASFTFPVPGVYVVVLQANSSNPNECGPDTASAIIQVVCPVIADFQVSNPNPMIGETVTFTNTSQNATQFEWFIDGVSKGSVLASTVFNQSGTYAVRLEAGNGFCKKVKFLYIAVSDSCSNVTFQKAFGTPNAESGAVTTVLTDGQLLVTGNVTQPDGRTDILLLKTTVNGNVTWSRQYGKANTNELVAAVLATDDGGVVLGLSTDDGATKDIGWAKFDANGNAQWQYRVQTPGTTDYLVHIRALPGGGFVILGGISGIGGGWAAYVARLDANGNQLWARCYDLPGTDVAYDAALLPDGGLLVAGIVHEFSLGFGNHDGLLFRLDANGNMLWNKAFGKTDNEGFNVILPMPDGNFLISGSTSSYNGPIVDPVFFDDGWLLKVTANGNILWSKVYRPSNLVDTRFRGLAATPEGDYVMSANDLGALGLDNAAMMRVNKDGQLIWSRQYGASGTQRLGDAVVLPGIGYAFTGFTDGFGAGAQDIFLLKTDENGSAGLCPDVQHQTEVLDATPFETSGVFTPLPTPAPVAMNLPVQNYALQSNQPCPVACDDPPPPCKSFQNTYGTTSNDRGITGIEMPGGGYLLGGNTTQNGTQDILITRTDANGEVLWSKRYGSPNRTELTFDLQAKPDGGFILSFTLGNPSDAAFAVCDPAGNVLFSRRITTPAGSQTDVFYDIIATSDGGYLAAGSFSPAGNTFWAAFFLKMDANGATQWYRGWDAAGTDFVTGVRELPGGGYIASGYGTSYGLGGVHDGVAYRLDAAGNLLWTKAYGTPAEGGFSNVAIAADGGFLFAAGLWNFSIGNYPEGGIVRTDANGNMLWTKLYRPSNNLDWETAGLVNTPDGNFVLAGLNRPNTGDTKAYLLKIDAAGQLIWSRQYGGSGLESLSDVRALASGSLLWTGRTTSAGSGGEDFYVLKTDADGHAGLCPETPHTTATIPIQFVQSNGSLQEIAPPVLEDFNLGAQPVTVVKTEICAPDCIPDPPCENTWIKTFGTPGVQQGGTNIIQAKDGNFFISGFRNDSSLLMKMTPAGQPVWVRSFKFTSGKEERINQIIEDSDGHLVGCGMFEPGPFRGFTFRYNPSSDLVDWAQENPANPQTIYYTIQEKAPGDNFVSFNSYHNSPAPGSFDDAHWVEIDRNTGQFVNAPHAFSFGSSEGILDVQQRAGNWYAVGRYTYGASLDHMRASVSSFDLQGNVLWSRMLFFDATAAARNYASDFVFDGADMVTIVFGDFNGANGTTEEIGVCKTDPNGNVLWAKRYALPLIQAYAKSIVVVPNGYIVLASEQSASQTPAICMFFIDKNGNVQWARQFTGYRIIRGEKLLVVSGNYLYFTAQHLGDGDLAVGKIRVSDGHVGGSCPEPADIAVSAIDLPLVSNAVNLISYPSPITQAARNVPAGTRTLDVAAICMESCTPEICNNALDDDGDSLIDCLDPDCDCHSCDGSETNIWYFGRQAGLDFSDDPPVVLTNGKTNTNEASAVASDPLGRLIFYTDGKTIFQRDHVPMPNGSGLFGHTSSSQTVIVPHPGNPARYYVFYPDSYDNGPAYGLSYSEVDMTLNGGLGDVPSGQKNLSLVPPGELVEQVSAVRHCNGTDYWVLSHRKTTNAFLAYLIDQTGLKTTPVVSNAGTGGPAPNGNYDVVGQLKIAPDGLHLARALFHTSAVEIFDFDASTGIVSNPVLLKAPGMINPYGVEFSPTGRFLYASSLASPSGLFQFDLLAGNAAAVAASAIQLASFPGTYHFGQLQVAKNGKIYVTNSGPLLFTTKLGIIHRPDEGGAGCLYQENGQTLAGTPGTNLNLPNFLVSYFWKPAIWFDETKLVDTICQYPLVQTYSLKKLPCGIQSVDWKISGTGTILSQTKETVTVRFDQAGGSEIVAHAVSECGEAADTVHITVLEPSTAVLDLGPDRIACENGVAVLDAGPGFQKYRWYDGTTGQTNTPTIVPGKYWVDVWDNCGNKQSDTLEISVIPATALDLGPDPSACAGSEQSFQLPAPFTAWHWYPGDYLSCSDCPTVVSKASVNTSYIVVAESPGGCLSADTITIQIVGDTAQSSIQLTTCPGETASWNGQNLPPGGPYPFAFTTVNCCDSTVLVTVLEIDSVLNTLQLVTCPGETINWNGQNLPPGGPYTFVFTAANGCDSTLLISVTELDTVLQDVQLAICAGEAAFWNGQPVLPGGPYPFVFTAANGCDSTIMVTVTELDTVWSAVQLLTCPGEPVVWNGQSLTPGGPYPFVFTAANGCDSTILVTVTELDTVWSAVQLLTCPGEPVVWNGQSLAPGGPYPFVFTASNGCDSTILVTVAELDTALSAVQLLTCPGEPVAWNGQSLAPGGPYPFVFTAANGCDSTIMVTVAELDTVLSIVQLVTCPGEPALWNGQSLAPGAYTFVSTASNGCDSTVLVTVLEVDSIMSAVQLVTCPGQPAVWNGQSLLPGGPYPFGLKAVNGCDSTVFVTVTALDTILSGMQLLTCAGEPVVWNGQSLLPGGPYPFVFTGANGCDSTVMVTVMGLDTVLSSLQLTTCPGEPAVWNGQSLLPGGPYPFAFNAANGCDSTILVTVLEADTVLNAIQLLSCPGEPAVWNGQSLIPGGPYPFVFTAINGCDSTVLVTVEATTGVTVNLPAVAQINLGHSLQLIPVIQGAPPLQYSWTPPDQLSCNTCKEPFASPQETSWFTLKVTDNRGCMATDSILLRVNPLCDIYLPNAFQPDDDGQNDWFYPETAPCVRLVHLLRVYSRWGELVFERRDFAPNQETLGWNGRFRERDMSPGVFAWYAEFELSNGQQMLLKGDVTVVR